MIQSKRTGLAGESRTPHGVHNSLERYGEIERSQTTASGPLMAV